MSNIETRLRNLVDQQMPIEVGELSVLMEAAQAIKIFKVHLETCKESCGEWADENERLTTEDARKADVISHLDSEIERLRGWLNVSGGLPCPNTQCHDTGGFPVDDGHGGCEEQQCEFCWTCDESIFMRARVSSSQEPIDG